MLHGWHLIFSVYGFWPPNDPRGSGSTRVRAQHIYEAGGDATKVHTTRSVAGRPHDMRLRRIVKESLKYPAVELSGLQARAVGRGIAATIPKVGLTIHACAIMPDHMHVVVAAHRFDGDEIIAYLKRAGTRGMNDEGLHPLREFARKSGKHPSPWAEGGWKVMLFTPAQMRARIRYVEGNPVQAGLPRQRWSFVAPYLG
jgi:REP element-mobilizing transposase RayT